MPAIILALPTGLLLGSFVTVLAHRLPRHEPFVAGRSRCPDCGAQIAAYDNVPLLSWLWLRGRCRACGGRISARYPLAELSVGLLYPGTVLALGTDDAGQLAMGLVLCTVLVAVSLTDFELRIIPNALVLGGGIAGLVLLAVADPTAVPAHLLAAALSGGVLFVIALAYPRGMGMGDVKLVAMMGLYLGRAVAPALLVAFAAGAVVGLVMIARQGADARKNAIPFGPFLALGGIVGLWFGDTMVDWYLDTFTGG
jgi:leader peptidase (prepilin peptidase) / N-methyltransferase